MFNTLIKHIGRERMYKLCALTKNAKVFKALYGYSPVDLNSVIKLSYISTRDIVKFCVSKGYILTNENITEAISCQVHRDVLDEAVENYGKVDKSFVDAAIGSKDAFSILRMLGAHDSDDECYTFLY